MIGYHDGKEGKTYETEFDYLIDNPVVSKMTPITSSRMPPEAPTEPAGEFKMAGDIQLPPTLPYGTRTDSDTPGVATNPDAYYDERIRRQPYRGDPTEGVYQLPNAGRPKGDKPFEKVPPKKGRII